MTLGDLTLKRQRTAIIISIINIQLAVSYTSLKQMEHMSQLSTDRVPLETAYMTYLLE